MDTDEQNIKLKQFCEKALVTLYQCAPGYWDTHDELEHELAAILGEDEVALNHRLMQNWKSLRDI